MGKKNAETQRQKKPGNNSSKESELESGVDPHRSELVQLKSTLNGFPFPSITQAAFFKGIANE